MKKGILVVSFGTSYEDTRKRCIESIEKRIEKEFEDFDVRRAFTSSIIINKLKKRDNIYIDNVEEALERFQDEGFDEVYIQSLHIIPGHEYNKLLRQVEKFKEDNRFKTLKVGKPLLYDEENHDRAIDAIKDDILIAKDSEGIVLMGHGTDHSANKYYKILEDKIREKGFKNVYIGTVEGYQPVEEIIPKIKEEGIEKVKLQPFMLVAGDHAQNDMVGEEDSWKEKFEKEGILVEGIVKGLGEKNEIQDIFIQELKQIIVDS